MADKYTGGKSNGGGRPRPDNTTMPGQYPAQLPFGLGVPQGTGAPGTQGSGVSPDPTVHTPTPEDNFGAHFDDLHTGSPGSAGATTGSATGAAYTEPFSHIAGGGAGQKTGGSIDTEAQADKAGHPGPFGTPYPLSTGAGNGKPMIGGRGGR